MSVTSSEEANMTTIRRVFDEFVNQGDFSLVDKIYQPDMIDHQPLPGAPGGTDGVRYTIAGLRGGFPDLHVTIEAMSGHGDYVVVHNTWRGTHTADFLGFPPTGRPVEFTGVVVWRLADGLIAERWGIGVESTLMADLGIARLVSGARPGRYRRGDAETVSQALPLLPGQADEWRTLQKELRGSRLHAYESSRRRLGIVREAFSLQESGGTAVVTHLLEARDPQAAARRMTLSDDPFDQWLRESAQRVHGTDPWAALAEGRAAESGLDWKVSINLSATDPSTTGHTQAADVHGR